jgi:hypothetical protein
MTVTDFGMLLADAELDEREVANATMAVTDFGMLLGSHSRCRSWERDKREAADVTMTVTDFGMSEADTVVE